MLFLPAWCGLDDAALLAHYRSDRGVVFDAIVDPEEVLPKRLEGLMHGRFEFNGETHSLGDPIDWLHNPSADIEWHILLQKRITPPACRRRGSAAQTCAT